MEVSMITEQIRTVIRDAISEHLSLVNLPEKEFATAKHCKARFDLSHHQLKKLYEDGEIRGRKIGDSRQAAMLYKLQDIREYLNGENESLQTGDKQ